LQSELETVAMFALSNLSSWREEVPFRLGRSVTPRASDIILKERGGRDAKD
jgi:hypothetical protein